MSDQNQKTTQVPSYDERYRALWNEIFSGTAGDYFRDVKTIPRPYTTADFEREYFIPNLALPLVVGSAVKLHQLFCKC